MEDDLQKIKIKDDLKKLKMKDDLNFTVGATRLGPKVAGVPQIDELRPITLLNCDCKILTKLFVLRMIPILIFVIIFGQLCTVGKKNILFGVNNLLSSISYAKQKKLGGCLISLDFFKAMIVFLWIICFR